MDLLLLLLTFICIPLARPFTVITPDPGAPSMLIDGPQTGLSMNKNGARTDAREQEAVYDIMKATGNEWAVEIPDVCRGRWHGIECMPDNDNVYHVVSLSFGALSNDASFPTCDHTRSFISPSVTDLPHIRTLFFYRCFTRNPQPIPAFLGRLGSSLQTLVLRENGHVGPIPTELGNITNLRVLDLHKNDLNGSIPVSFNRLTDLRSLDLSENKLTGSIPNVIFPMLNVLDLNRNHLVGSIPTTITRCYFLMKIDLSHNRLSGSIPEPLGHLKNLILLDLSYNSLSGPLPISLKDLNSLQALMLNGNPMASTTIPDDIFNGLKHLMILVMSDMNLQGIIPEKLGRLQELRMLHLDRNQLNGSIPTSLGNLENISELRLNDNELTGSVPFKREMLWRMRRKLKLQNNPGLCFDSRTGVGDDSGAFSDLGIGDCELPGHGFTRTVQQFSIVGNKDPALELSSTQSDGAINRPVLLCKVLHLVMLILFIVSVL